MKPKNIIVCADGTGNKGGYSPDSNVYRIYKAVDKDFTGKCDDDIDITEQIIFYDNGVGTDDNKFLRKLGGAIGLGFERNVCDLYKFLARNYVPGDRVYFFGFSRGASTIRACNGMINKCGLAKGAGLRNSELDLLVKESFEAYKCHKKTPSVANNLKNSKQSYGDIPVQFIGLWDTVVALGFPKRTKIMGPVTLVLNMIFAAAEKGLDFLWPHSFYYYKLTDNVKYACQALSLDDERTAFWPYVWDETGREKDSVEQVWFAGVHSNVGGGYERSGMACIPLYWVMQRARSHGLIFQPDTLKNVYYESHTHGRIYNSRDGLGVFYRYYPRVVENLCKEKLLGEIKIHHSVMERMKHRTANYAPGFIPERFDVVNSEIPAVTTMQCHPEKNEQWKNTRQLIDKLVLRRKRLYEMLLVSIITIFFAAIKFQDKVVESSDCSGISGFIADKLNYILPDFFKGLIELTVVQKPYYFIAAISIVALILYLRKSLLDKILDARELLRHHINC